jgi:hypothetical protein
MDSPLETKIAEALEELYCLSKSFLRAVEKKYGVSKQIARCSQQLLSSEHEKLLVSWILMLESEGHAPTHSTVREMAGQISRI